MRSLIASTQGRLDVLVGQYVTGKLGARQFGQAMEALLVERHTRAAVLGRQRAGDYRARNSRDEVYGRIVGLEQNRYIRGFVQALLSGRYADEQGIPDVSRIQRRAAMYTARLVATANETFVAASADYTFTWHLGGAEQSCSDCPRLAAGGPYSPFELPTVPRQGQTECRVGCRCFLMRSDGIRGFSAE